MPTEWIHALLGGMMIGAAASLLLYLNGRILGVSGIFYDTFSGTKRDFWRWAFLAGVVLGAPVAAYCFQAPITVPAGAPNWTILAAGLLVGFGVRLGTGCTFGHGVCGVGRLAPRSLLATACFVFAGIVSVWAFRALGVLR